MFSCIYFHEDASLGVVGKNDKCLKILGEFKKRCPVEMKWGKTLFHGTIIKTGECKATLDQFATAANKKILKKISIVPKEVPEELFLENGNTEKSEMGPGKRQRVQQETIQGEAPSVQGTKPKKSKVGQERKKTAETVSKKTKTMKSKKDLEGAAELAAATSMCLQFGDTPLTETWDLCCGGSSKTATDGEEQIITSNQTSLPHPPSELLDVIKLLYKPEVKSYLEALARHAHHRLENSSDNVPEIQELSSTQFLGTSKTSRPNPTCTITSSSTVRPPHDISTVPPPPHDINRPNPLTNYDSVSEPDFDDRTPPILPYPDYSSSHIYGSSFSTPEVSSLSSYTFMSTPFPSPTPDRIQSTYSQQSYSPHIDHLDPNLQNSHTSIPQVNQTTDKQPTYNYATLLPLNNQNNMNNYIPEESRNVSVSRKEAQPRRTSPRKLSNIFDKNQEMEQTLYQVPLQQLSMEQTPPLPKRTSPRKASANTSNEDQMKVKLMDNSSIVVDREMLRKATSGAAKASNPGYALCMKILPLLFTTTEMARSRGQGLTKKKEGDLRPVLDKEKIRVMKDYVASWCAKNGHLKPSDAKLNDGVTEKIAYCRKLLKKQE